MPPTPISDLLAHLDELLSPSAFRDYGPNGLQVPGPEEIQHIVTGVSANAALFERAAELGADLVLVHHGLFWDGAPRALDRAAKRRLQLLFDNDMALAAYHLPLDAHPELGNNALLAQGLGAVSSEPFAEHGGRAIGLAAFFDEPVPRDLLIARVAGLTGRDPLVFPAGPDPVRSIGIVSGAAPDDIHAAIARRLDAFLTGEPAERVMGFAQESGITFIAAGHHATERFGIRRLGEHLAGRFDVGQTFVDIPNPI